MNARPPRALKQRNDIEAMQDMDAAINPLVLDTGSPPIPQVQEWGRAYAGGRGPPIDLCQAVPGYPPAPEMLERLAAAAADPACAKYGPIPGDAPLREAYAAELSASYGGRVRADNVTITAGCNQAFFTAMLTLAGRGDAVLLPTPWYFNHPMTLGMLGIEARPLPCTPERGFVPDPEQAEALLDGRVRAIVLVTPNNPTGAIYPAEVVRRFHALCRRRGLWLVLDETYRDFLPAGRDRSHDLPAGDAWPEGVVQLYSFSKSFAVPGARLGALCGPAALQAQFAKVLDCMTICPQRPAQAAVAWALGALGGWRAGNRAEMNRRAAAVGREFARAAPAWRIESLGAYFAYVRHPFPGAPAWAVVEHLATRHGVTLLPATAFAGSDDHVRVSFANVDEAGIRALADRLAGVEAGPRALAA